MRASSVIVAVFTLSLSSPGLADPLTVSCPPAQSVPCTQLDNLDITGRPDVSGGCGGASVMYRDSTLAPDSLLVRIWLAEDTCDGKAVCFQPIVVLTATPRVAVLPLENLSTAEEGARVLQRLLEDALASSPDHELVSPAKADDAIMRNRIRQPVLMDDNQRAQLATTLDAQYFLIGSLLNYQVYQDQYSGPIPIISCVLQLQRAADGKAIWAETMHAVGNDGEWLFALGVEHDITRLGRNLSRKAAGQIVRKLALQPCGGAR